MKHTHAPSQMKKMVAALTLALLLSLMVAAAAMAGSAKYTVAVSSLNLRKYASASATKVATLKKGAVVTVTGLKDGWCRISYNGRTCYAASKYLKKGSSSSSSGVSITKLAGSPGIVNCNTSLYKSFSTSSSRVTSLSKGSKVSVIGLAGSWYQVKCSSGKIGFVGKTAISKPSTSSGASSAGSYRSLGKGASGTAVKKLQKRLSDLNYLSSSQVNGSYGSGTVRAIKRFQMQAGLTITGTASAATQARLYSSRAPKRAGIVKMDWFKSNINSLFGRGSTAYIIDCATDTRIRIRRVQGTNHADVEPATAADTAKLKSLFGSWSWDTRSVILIADGRYVAASINGMPHGEQTSTTNNFNGHFCLHTTNSRTHATDNINDTHQSRILSAYNYLK